MHVRPLDDRNLPSPATHNRPRVPSIPHLSPLVHARPPPSAFDCINPLGSRARLRLQPTSALVRLVKPMHACSSPRPIVDSSSSPPSFWVIAESAPALDAAHAEPLVLTSSHPFLLLAPQPRAQHTSRTLDLEHARPFFPSFSRPPQPSAFTPSAPHSSIVTPSTLPIWLAVEE